MPATDVLDIGNAALDVISIFLDERQLPELLTPFLRATHDSVRQGLLITENAAHLGAQGDHASASQSSQIDHVIRLLFNGKSQSISENQAAFGIGVQDFDGF